MALTAEQIVHQFGQFAQAMADVTTTLKVIQEQIGRGSGSGDTVGTEVKHAKNKKLEGKVVENFRKFSGGEAE